MLLVSLFLFAALAAETTSAGAATAPLSDVSPPAVITINELAYDVPGEDDGHEWVEVSNGTGASVDLAGWKFNDGSNHMLAVPPEKGGQGTLVLEGGGFAILADDAATFLADHSAFTGTVIDTVLSLPNAGGTVRLLRKDDSVSDSLSYTRSQGAAGNGRTLERTSSGTLQESAADGGTPGKPNSNGAPPSSSSSLAPSPPSQPSPSLPSVPADTAVLNPSDAATTNELQNAKISRKVPYDPGDKKLSFAVGAEQTGSSLAASLRTHKDAVAPSNAWTVLLGLFSVLFFALVLFLLRVWQKRRRELVFIADKDEL